MKACKKQIQEQIEKLQAELRKLDFRAPECKELYITIQTLEWVLNADQIESPINFYLREYA